MKARGSHISRKVGSAIENSPYPDPTQFFSNKINLLLFSFNMKVKIIDKLILYDHFSQ